MLFSSKIFNWPALRFSANEGAMHRQVLKLNCPHKCANDIKISLGTCKSIAIARRKIPPKATITMNHHDIALDTRPSWLSITYTIAHLRRISHYLCNVPINHFSSEDFVNFYNGNCNVVQQTRNNIQACNGRRDRTYFETIYNQKC